MTSNNKLSFDLLLYYDILKKVKFYEEMKAVTEGLEEKVKEASENGKLSCSRAFKIAEETEADIGEIGKVANRLDIKIIGCQLGCF